MQQPPQQQGRGGPMPMQQGRGGPMPMQQGRGGPMMQQQGRGGPMPMQQGRGGPMSGGPMSGGSMMSGGAMMSSGGGMPPANNAPPVRGQGPIDAEAAAAIKRNDMAGLMAVVQRGSLNAQGVDEHGWTLLHLAARLGQTEATKVLLQLGCNPNTVNSHGDTPLHYASSEGHPQVAALLLQRAANPNIQNQHGNTPVHYACYWQNGNIANALVQRGGNIQMANKDGETPIAKAPEQFRPTLQATANNAARASGGGGSGPGSPGASMGSQNSMASQQQAMMASQQQAMFQQQQAQFAEQQRKQQAELERQRKELDAERARMARERLENGAGMEKGKDGKMHRRRHDWEIDGSQVTREKFIGKGGFGEVYRGEWQGTTVAVKTMLAQKISDKAMAEFTGEIDVMSKLRHPNIVLFMAACITPPDMCIVTEFVDRGSLYSVLHNKKTEITWKMMLKFATDAARGINYLHHFQPCIMHRDLKSLNLLCDEHWGCKVTDFGLSMLKQEGTDGANAQCGTPQWMAPELLRNETYDEKSDVYSFGVCMWEMYTRQEPYAGMNPMQVGVKVLLEGMRPPIPPHCPHLFHRLIADCWATNPAQRPTFTTVLERLKVIKERTCK